MSTSMTFILSTGRTGTSFLGDKLNQFDDVVSLQNPSPKFEKESSRFQRKKSRSFKKTKFRENLPLGTWYRLKFKLSRTWKKLIHFESQYVELNQYIVPLLPEVKQIFPDATYIHLIREPRDCIRSFINKGHLENRTQSLSQPTVGEATRKEWKGLNPIERINWLWLNKNKRIQACDPDMVLRYKSIFEPPHEDFQRLLESLGVEDFDPGIFQQKVNNSWKKLLPPYEEWEDEWKEEVQESVEWFQENFEDS